jgi:hypothetical protein
MASMLEAVQNLDRDLALSVATELQVVAKLRGIEASSLRAIVEWVTRYVDGERDPDAPVDRLPEFIGRARERVLDYVGGHVTVESREDLEAIRRDIGAIAEETGVSSILTYAIPQPKVLLERMQELGKATEDLAPNEQLEYESARRVVRVRDRFALGAAKIEELLTADTQEGVIIETLVVKKPDYLGSSMWQFKYGAKLIEAKISDVAWLARFHSRSVELHPGDAISARISAVINRDQEGRIVSERYTVAEVLSVIRASDHEQPTLPIQGAA